MRPAVLVFNGWAAGPEAWQLTTFPRDWTFSYLEELDGLPSRVIPEFDRVVLVGFSMGGTMALESALAFPEKLAGMVLVSATPRMMEAKAEGWKGMSLRRREALRLGTELVFRGDPSPLYAPANLDRGLDYLLRTDLRARLAARAPWRGFPTAIFQSERDGIVRPGNADFLRGVFPDAELTYVPGAEHVLPVAVPELIDSAVERILVPYED